MRRNLTLVLILALVLALAFPTVALAKRGGVPANGKSNGKAPVATAGAPETGDEAGQEQADKPGKSEDKGKKDAAEEEAPASEGAESEEPDAEQPEKPEKLTGVENALSRLQRNLERMQAQLEAGKRDSLPEGLQSAIAKFMSWLGIEPPSEEAENTDEGSTETSGTIEPEPEEDDQSDAGAGDVLEAPAEE